MIDCNCVMGLEGVDDVLCVVLACILKEEVVDDKAKSYGTGFMDKKPGDQSGVNVTCSEQEGDELIIGEASSLGKSIHPFHYFNVDVVVVDEFAQFVIGNDSSRDITYMNLHILRPLHGSIQIEILDIDGHGTGVRSRDNTVDECFSCLDCGGFRTDVVGIIDTIASYRNTEALWFNLVWFVGCNKFGIRRNIPCWNLSSRYEAHCVCTFRNGDACWRASLTQTPVFASARVFPKMSFAACEEFGVLGRKASVAVDGGSCEVLIKWSVGGEVL